MSADAIPDFLAEQRDEAPEELQPLILDFENYWERKLWHQLTEALVEFFSHPGSAPKRLAFYRVFILKFADKINQLKLVELALKAATECEGKAPYSVPSEAGDVLTHHVFEPQRMRSACNSFNQSPRRSTTRTRKMHTSLPWLPWPGQSSTLRS